jgi:hypothetical protein
MLMHMFTDDKHSFAITARVRPKRKNGIQVCTLGDAAVA